MNCKSMFIFAALLLVIITATPFLLYAKEYHSSVQLTALLQNECSSEDGTANCANNNAETYGDENVISPQISQSSQTKTGEGGKPGPPGPPGPSSTLDLIHVVWHDDLAGNFDTLYSRYGADFDPSKLDLSDNPADGFNPAIATLGNNVYVVWHDGSDGNFDIFYRQSTDGGATFGPIINLSDNLGVSHHPAIAVSGDNVYVVWHDESPGNFDILYRRSTDAGVSFVEPIKNLSDNPDGSFSPAISASAESVHVVWQDFTPGNNEILYKRSLDGGDTFPEMVKNLSDNSGTSSDIAFNPAIATVGNIVHVVWDDNTPGNFDILYIRSLDGGDTFADDPSNLSDNPGVSSDPEMAAHGDNVHVVWVDNIVGNNDISYTRSVDGGSTFAGDPSNLSNSKGFSDVPAIAANELNVYVVWSDDTSGNHEILYTKSTDNGVNFSDTLSNLSTNSAVSHAPAIAVSE